MATVDQFSNPRPGVTPAKKVRRAGVPNHQHTTSGETPMVSARIFPDHFPTPHLALRAGANEQKVRGFATAQADAATRIAERLMLDAGPDASIADRLAAVEAAYADAVAWRYSLARSGAIVGGTAAVDGADAERFRTPITDNSPNLDRIGTVGRFRDGSEWDAATRTYVGGVDTPASRTVVAFGEAARARFAVEAPDSDVLANVVRLPDGSYVPGNVLIRRDAALAAARALAERVAARGLDASRMETGGDPLYVVTATEADRARIRRAAFALLAADEVTESTWWQADYLTYQAPTYKKGSDAAHRVFLVAAAWWRLGWVPALPHDIDLRCMVLGQTAATALPHICGGAA